MKYVTAVLMLIVMLLIAVMAFRTVRGLVRYGYRLSARDVPVFLSIVTTLVLMLLLMSWILIAF